MANPSDPAEGSNPDLRRSAHEDLGVEVERDLSGSGHLARGDKSRMSSLRFRAKGVARTERDPVFERPLEQPTPDPAPADRAQQTEESAPAARSQEADTGGNLLKRVGRLLGL